MEREVLPSEPVWPGVGTESAAVDEEVKLRTPRTLPRYVPPLSPVTGSSGSGTSEAVMKVCLARLELEQRDKKYARQVDSNFRLEVREDGIGSGSKNATVGVRGCPHSCYQGNPGFRSSTPHDFHHPFAPFDVSRNIA